MRYIWLQATRLAESGQAKSARFLALFAGSSMRESAFMKSPFPLKSGPGVLHGILRCSADPK
jgi:hypothetical protein